MSTPTSAATGLASFEQLEAGYNLLPPSERDAFFISVMLDVLKRYPRPNVVVDIGCGEGIGTAADKLTGVRSLADQLWGIEPDKSITPKPGVFDRFEHALFEDCTIPDNSVDLAYSCMVMEHVTNPQAFMTRLYRCLKPGGSYVFLTVNGAHYFARIANAMRNLKIDEKVLRIVRPGQVVESYHYPTAYQFNKPSQIDRTCQQLGFEAPRYVFAEHIGAKCYFPGPTKLFWHTMIAKRRLIKNPRSLLELICWIRKPAN